MPRALATSASTRSTISFRIVELARDGDQRDHDLRLHGLARLLLDQRRRLEDGAGLHLVDLGIGDAEPAAAMAQHRVGFLQHRRALGDMVDGDAGGLGHLLHLAAGIGQELVQRRIEQADGHRQALHDAEQLDEIVALHGQDLGQRRAAPLDGLGHDHLAHGDDAAAVEEHMLGAAEPDALGAEAARHAGIVRRLGVGAHLHPPVLVRPDHQLGEIAGELGLDGRRPRPASPRRCRRRW